MLELVAAFSRGWQRTRFRRMEDVRAHAAHRAARLPPLRHTLVRRGARTALGHSDFFQLLALDCLDRRHCLALDILGGPRGPALAGNDHAIEGIVLPVRVLA